MLSLFALVVTVESIGDDAVTAVDTPLMSDELVAVPGAADMIVFLLKWTQKQERLTTGSNVLLDNCRWSQ